MNDISKRYSITLNTKGNKTLSSDQLLFNHGDDVTIDISIIEDNVNKNLSQAKADLLLLHELDDNPVIHRFEDGGINISDNVVTILCKNSYINKLGVSVCQLIIRDEDQSITTQMFSYKTNSTLVSDEVINAADKIDTLVELDKTIENCKSKILETSDLLLQIDNKTNQLVSKVENEILSANSILREVERAESERVITFDKIKKDNESLKSDIENTITNVRDGVTPNISIGNVTTLDPGVPATVVRRGNDENPIFDFGIPKGADGVGGGNANIDDNTISKTSTWSSEKIEDFVHTNDDVVWSTVQGENLSIDYTKEGYLREVEIWGNTIQGFADCVTNKQIVDSILSTGLDDSAKINDDGTFTITYAGFGSTTDWSTINKEGFIQLEPNTKYSVGCWRNNGAFPKVYYILYEEMGIKGANGYAIPTFTTGASGKVLLYPASAQSGKLNLRVVKGGYKLTNYPYDFNLGHIQHLGELYVDEKGQPILDSEGREQYKVEIGSAFGLNLANTIIPQYQAFQDGTTLKTESGYRFTNIKDSKGSNIKFNMSCDTSKTYTIQMDIASNTMVNSSLKFLRHTAYTPIATVSGGSIQRVKFKLQPYATDILFYLNITPIVENQYVEIENIIIFEGDYTNFEYDIEDTTQHKTTLLLPCQLSKVGDISDRLYWDSEKKKYVVEKNIVKYEILDTDSKTFYKSSLKTHSPLHINPSDTSGWNTTAGDFIIVSNYSKSIKSAYLVEYNNIYCSANKQIIVIVENSSYNDDFEGWVNRNKPFIFRGTNTPQLIETNIIEQILLPCYKDKTHLFVTGGIDGSIKAKVPLDGGQAIQSLSARNVALIGENEEIKKTNTKQDELIDVSLCATDETFVMLEPILEMFPQTINLEREVSKMVDLYVAMVIRGLKKEEEVPARYREQVKEILEKLDK